MESHVAFVAIAEVRADVGGPHVGFGQDDAILVLGVDDGADFLDLQVGFGDVLAGGALALDEIGHRVQAQPVDAHVEPEAHGGENFFLEQQGVVEVEVGLVREETVPVELLGLVVPGPVGFFGVGEDDADALVEAVGVGPERT